MKKALQAVASVGRWFGRLTDVQIPSETKYGVRIR